jgi:asparagine synthase (glutamine-hydrolysing)
MCGIAGLWTPGTTVSPEQLNRLSQALQHRGPDAHGLWHSADIGLAHRRLAVVDLTHAGAQPMISHSGRFVLVYNGELYNTEELKGSLAGRTFRGHSDTEVLLERLEQLGADKALDGVDGMFAFALYDQHEKTLWLARDRLGEKPLFYGWVGNTFVFASELSAIRTVFGGELTLDRGALAGFLRHNYLTAETSAFNEIQKVRPGTVLRLNFAAAQRHEAPQVLPYWTLLDAMSQVDMPKRLEDTEAELLEMLQRSIRGRMLADVPLGCFLSGGIDSSLITALSQEASMQPVSTFTMGFRNAAFDESAHARAVAEHLGTRHTDMIIDEDDLLSVVDTLHRLTSEPFADSSFIPTLLLSRLTRQHVTVALSGDGGDELFWGYTRYPLWERACRLRAQVPSFVRPPLVRTLQSGVVSAVARRLSLRNARGVRFRLDQRLRSIGSLLDEPDDRSLYRSMISHHKRPDTFIPGGAEPETPYGDGGIWRAAVPDWRKVSLTDTLAYLPNDILTKVDRASMAASLETRVPLLDHRIVAFASCLPRQFVVDGDGGKRPLRRLLAHYVPEQLTNRPKQGFGVPMNDWLRGPLRSWLLDTLQESTLRQQGVLACAPTLAMRDAHLENEGDYGPHLWDLAMLTAWIGQR